MTVKKKFIDNEQWSSCEYVFQHYNLSKKVDIKSLTNTHLVNNHLFCGYLKIFKIEFGKFQQAQTVNQDKISFSCFNLTNYNCWYCNYLDDWKLLFLSGAIELE